MSQTTLTEIASILQKAHRLLVITHIAPDGDAIGSLLGFGWILRNLPAAWPPRALTLVSADGVPNPYQFLPGSESVVTTAPRETWDAVVALDASDPQRLGAPFRPQEYGNTPVIVLDHHITNLEFGTLNWVDPASAATAQVMVDLADALNVPISSEAATCLLTGLVTDTRGFRTSNVSLAVMNTATRLMQLGADLADITERSLNYKPLNIMRLWGPALSQMQLQGHVAWTSISQGMREPVHAPDNGDGGLVSFLLNAPEANIAAVFTEKSDGQVEVGLRARPGYDVAHIALSLGGGGHPQASGCTISGTLAAAIQRVLPLLFAAAEPAR